ncbi:hypothetical protein EV714DRAFT_243749 [Schizophyllum commune]
MASHALQLALFVLRIVSPATVLIAAASLLFAKPSAPATDSGIVPVVVASTIPRRGLILTLLSLAALTYLADGLVFVVYAVLQKQWPYMTGIEIGAVVGLAAYAGTAAVGAWKDVQGVEVWSLKRLRLAVALAFAIDVAQVIILGFYTQSYKDAPATHVSIRGLLHLVFPVFRILVLLPLLWAFLVPRVVYTPVPSEADVEEQPTDSSFLLPPGSDAHASSGMSPVAHLGVPSSKYGTFRSSISSGTQTAPPTRSASPAPSQAASQTASKTEAKPDVTPEPTWGELWQRMKRISPYLWPSKSSSLQLVALLCIIVLLIGRVVNFGIPFALGELVNIFEGTSTRSPWPILFGYVGLRFLAGSGGLAALRDTLWAPVMQYSDREMSQLAFDHLLNLSFAFHTRRKTGEILRVLDRGAAINRTLELILFNFVPIFLDIVIALVVFATKFEWTLTVVIFIVMFAYGYASIVMTQWRTKLRRRMNERDIKTRGIHTDCLLNYETVKYFGGEEHEGERYRKSINKYQALEYQVIISLNLLNLVQNLIISLGLLIGSLIVALRVTRGQSSTGDFIIFITYLTQLYGPLNMLGTTYRAMNQSLVDTEKLLNLLNEPTDVNDKPDAKDLVVENGEIEFKDVNFSYDGRTTALRGVSFKVPKGSSVALVGDSGSGKSTILRLLYRFYDLAPGDGSITIDGQDIRDVTQKSLRSAIGVVPQDTVLFNSSIAYNISYGKFGASMEEVEAAAASAQMHDRILSFPDGYDTKVGERGVRLSGGEKQRIAIARTLLKNPPILLLDEATSALDTSTEKDIQNALQNLMVGRSSLSIAHRLSTIANADVILVLKNGQIVEQGNFKELLAQDGVFASMWADQVAASETDHEVTIDIKDLKSKEEPGYDVEQEEQPQPTTTHEEPAVSTDATAAEPAGEPSAPSHHTAPSEPQDEPAAHDQPSEGASTAAPEVPPKDAEVSAPVAFPSADTESVAHAPEASAGEAPAPVAFPGSDDTASQAQSEAAPAAAATSTPGVTFDPTVDNTPSRTDTPDPDAEPKRKRISSQNFQRMARRISITTRRGTTSIIPTLKRNESTNSPRGSTDEGPSVRSDTESPAGSLNQKERKKIIKKEKKDKKEKKEAKRQSTL